MPERSSTQTPVRPTTRHRLVVISNTARADLVDPLKLFRSFEVWHLYRTLGSDISSARLDSRTMAFRNLLDLLVKIVKIRPSLIQGSEPYDFPHGFWLCCVVLLAAGILRRPYYFPTLENLPPESKFREWRGVRIGLLLVPLLRTFMRVYAGRALLVFALNDGSVKNLLAVGTTIDRIHRELYGYTVLGLPEEVASEDRQRAWKRRPQVSAVHRQDCTREGNPGADGGIPPGETADIRPAAFADRRRTDGL